MDGSISFWPHPHGTTSSPRCTQPTPLYSRHNLARRVTAGVRRSITAVKWGHNYSKRASQIYSWLLHCGRKWKSVKHRIKTNVFVTLFLFCERGFSNPCRVWMGNQTPSLLNSKSKKCKRYKVDYTTETGFHRQTICTELPFPMVCCFTLHF